MTQAERRSITRRQLVAASALIPAAALVSAPFRARATLPDPIFALIAAHARAYADLAALFAAQQAADQALQRADAAARRRLEARLDELCAAEGPLGAIEMQATDRLVRTVPATLAGAAATLAYVRERFERDDYPLCEEDGYRALLFSTERAIGRELALPPPHPTLSPSRRREGERVELA